MHCFAGSEALARECLDLGLLISFAGILTFKNATGLQAVARAVPLDQVLIETDSPYLAPVPHRGKRNEPAFVPLVAAKLAELKGKTIEDVALATSANASRLFRFPV
jgi:TatD DNase family protein